MQDFLDRHKDVEWIRVCWCGINGVWKCKAVHRSKVGKEWIVAAHFYVSFTAAEAECSVV
jgi:glutamine synthetase